MIQKSEDREKLNRILFIILFVVVSLFAFYLTRWVACLMIVFLFIAIIPKTSCAGMKNSDYLKDVLSVLHGLELEEMAQALKSQRHDFINHLQVIYGLHQTGNKEKLIDYIASASREASVDVALDKIQTKELRDFFQAIIFKAKGQDICVSFRVEENVVEFCQDAGYVLFFLRVAMQNLLSGLEKKSKPMRHLTIELKNTTDFYHISFTTAKTRQPEKKLKDVPEPILDLFGEGEGMDLLKLTEKYLSSEMKIDTKRNAQQILFKVPKTRGMSFTAIKKN